MWGETPDCGLFPEAMGPSWQAHTGHQSPPHGNWGQTASAWRPVPLPAPSDPFLWPLRWWGGRGKDEGAAAPLPAKKNHLTGSRSGLHLGSHSLPLSGGGWCGGRCVGSSGGDLSSSQNMNINSLAFNPQNRDPRQASSSFLHWKRWQPSYHFIHKKETLITWGSKS